MYIITNKHHTVFYTGVTADILSRAIEHRGKYFASSFTARYNLDKLVYMEHLPSIEEAIDREKQVKKYSRAKKLMLIEKLNPEWRDLFEDIKDW